MFIKPDVNGNFVQITPYETHYETISTFNRTQYIRELSLLGRGFKSRQGLKSVKKCKVCSFEDNLKVYPYTIQYLKDK